MSKMKLKFDVIGYHFDHMKPGEIHWTAGSCYGDKIDADIVHVQTQEVEVEVPVNINLVERQIASIEADKLKALEEYQATVAMLNERLSKLQAISCDGEFAEGRS